MLSAMIVDDEMPSNELLADLLRESGLWDVSLQAASAEEAVMLLQNWRARMDVAFLDINLPGMNGLALGQALRRIQPDLELVYVTGRTDLALEAFANEAFGYLVKPICRNDIERITSRWLRLSHAMIKAKAEEPVRIRSSVRCFGSFELSCGGPGEAEPIRWRTRKAKELFVLLLLQGSTPLSIERMLDALWPEVEEKRARTMLHTTMYQMRNNLDAAGIQHELVYSDNHYRLQMIDCWTDYEGFHQAMKGMPSRISTHKQTGPSMKSAQEDMLRIPRDRIMEKWARAHQLHRKYDPQRIWLPDGYRALSDEQDGVSCKSSLDTDVPEEDDRLTAYALSVYRGGFLAEEGYAWAESLSNLFHEMMVYLATNLVESRIRHHDHVGAMHVLHRAITLAPWEESLHQLLLSYDLQTGKRDAFIRHYHHMEKVLDEELGIMPSAASRKLLAEMNRT